ncbi:MAG: 4Fe-4S binding protein [Candidatus Helarchaeota archaeon]
MNPLEIAPKRKIFYELLIKILKLQQKEEIEIEFEDLKSLESELKAFKNEFTRFNGQYLLQLMSFLDDLKVLEKIDNPIFLKKMIEQLDSIQVKNNKEKDIITKIRNLFKAKINKIEKKEVQISIDRIAISRILKEINTISNELISKITPIYKNFIKERKLKEQELEEILKIYKEIQKIDNFKEFQNQFKLISRKLKDGGLIYSVSQINKSLNENKIKIPLANSLLLQNLFPKLDQAIISYIINTLGPQTIESLNQKTGIPTDKLFQGIVSILDRKEVEIINELEGEPVYSKLKIKSSLLESVNKVAKFISDFGNVFEQKTDINEIINNIGKFKKYSELIEKLDEKIFQNSIMELNSKLKQLSNLIPSSSIDETEEEIKNRIDAMIEALNLYRLNLTFEKKDALKEKSEEIDEKVSKLILNSIDQDFERGQIISIIKKKGPSTIIELSNYSGLSTDVIFSHMLQLKTDNRIKIIGIKEDYDLYDVPRVKTEEEILVENLINGLIIFQSIQQKYEKALLDIKLNLDKINKYIDDLSRHFVRISEISYLQQQFSEKLFEEFIEKCKTVSEILTNIKGKIKVKKAEINFDELVPILVPSTEEKYSHLIGTKQLIGFGTIKSIEQKCLSCRSCQDICEESAVFLKNIWNLPLIFELSEEELTALPETKRMLINIIKRIAIKKPNKIINIPLGAIGYGKPEFEPIKCIACKKCVERCPNQAIEFEEVWNFPKIIKSASESLILED